MGVAGLSGSGAEALMAALFGAARAEEAEADLRGRGRPDHRHGAGRGDPVGQACTCSRPRWADRRATTPRCGSR